MHVQMIMHVKACVLCVYICICIQRWCAGLGEHGSPGRFPGEAEKNHYSLRPVRDVAEHEAASVIGQPAHHEGYHHSSWTQEIERAELTGEAKYQYN